jgi:antitoxin YefM
MRACTYSDFRENLKERLDEVHETRAPLLVTRQNGSDAVVLDAEEHEGLMETLHLLRSPRNAERLLRSIAGLDAGLVSSTTWSSREADLVQRCLRGLSVLAADRPVHGRQDQP